MHVVPEFGSLRLLVIRQQADSSPKGSGYKARGSAIVRGRAEWAWLEQLQRRLSDAGRGS
jgi:hypothetical protein